MDARTATPTLAELIEMEVHPLAAGAFPMLADDELDDLAESIKANGLREPIVVAGGVLIDGRNRLEACRRAGIEHPPVDLFEGDDAAIREFILDRNVERRHLTPSQRSMALAIAYPDPEKGGRGKRSENTEGLSPHERNMLSKARFVLRVAPEYVPEVVAGDMSLDVALIAVRVRDARAKELAERQPPAPPIEEPAPSPVPIIENDPEEIAALQYVLDEMEARWEAAKAEYAPKAGSSWALHMLAARWFQIYAEDWMQSIINGVPLGHVLDDLMKMGRTIPPEIIPLRDEWYAGIVAYDIDTRAGHTPEGRAELLRRWQAEQEAEKQRQVHRKALAQALRGKPLPEELQRIVDAGIISIDAARVVVLERVLKQPELWQALIIEHEANLP